MAARISYIGAAREAQCYMLRCAVLGGIILSIQRPIVYTINGARLAVRAFGEMIMSHRGVWRGAAAAVMVLVARDAIQKCRVKCRLQ